MAQFLNPVMSLHSTPRLIMKQWARFSRCCADSSQGASVSPPTIAADSATDSTVTALVQGYINLNMPGIDFINALTSPAPCTCGQRGHRQMTCPKGGIRK